MLLRLDLVVIEKLVQRFTLIFGELGCLLLSLILHLLQEGIEHLLILLVEEDLLVALGLVIEGSAGESEVAYGHHCLSGSHGHCTGSLDD